MRLQAGGVQRTGKPSGLKRVPYTVFSLHMEESNMKKMKRIISAALTLALAAGMLAGCAGSSSGTPAASSAGGASAGSSSAERERITVRVFRSKASHEVAMDQMDVFKVMGEMFNIDFEFDNPPQENYTERLNLVMMETELPDVIMEIPVTDVLKYGETGVILPLNDYIENSMPNLKAEMDKRDGVEKALTYSGGNIYYLPMLDETPSGNIPYIVRTDWLDQLGLERPVTIEDWENYWSLVKTTDLNGNGKNDEIPFSAYEIERLRNFCTAWGVLDDFYTDPTDGGKVHYGPIEDKYKEALVWMNDMWNKGYIDQEIITTDYSAFSAKLAQNIVGSFAGPLGGMLAAQNATMAESVPGFHVAATEPPKGEAGVQIHTNIDLVPRAVVGATITSTCKNVDRVVEWLDYMYSAEGQMLLNMGIEGTHYTMQDGEPIFTDYILNNPDGLSPKQAVGTFTIAQGTMPSVLCFSETSQLDDAAVLEAKENCIIPFLEESNKYVIPGTLSFSSEKDAERRAAMSDIETYVDEMVMKFITGREPIENWDTYVAKVKEMGIENVIGIYQEALDAWNS